MTLTFPRPFPLTDFAECTIDLDPGMETSGHARGRRATVAQVREPVWFARFETPGLSSAGTIRWQAWLKSLRGPLRTFTAWDTKRTLPQAYWAAGEMPDDGGSPWDGIAVVTDLATPGEIALSGLPAGYQATAGDRIGLEETVSTVDKYGYFELMEDATADGSGEITLTVEPLVPALFSTAAAARLFKPLCAFRLVKGSVSTANSVDLPPVSFQAVQVL